MTPLGLFGVAKNSARVRGVIAASSFSQVHAEKPRAAVPATRTIRAAGYLERGRVARGYRGSERNHLVRRVPQITARCPNSDILRPGKKDDVGGVDLLARSVHGVKPRSPRAKCCRPVAGV